MITAIFPFENRSFFDNIIQLLHSGIHCDFDHTRSILLKSRDGFRPFFGNTRQYGAHYQTTRRARIKIEVFWTTRLHGGNHPDDGCFSPCRKPIIFNIIIIMMHFLHSCFLCVLGHSCVILHNSRDCFRLIFSPEYQNIWGHITRLHGGFFPKHGSYCPFFYYQTARGYHRDDGCICPRRKPIIFNNIIALITLLHKFLLRLLLLLTLQVIT